MRKDVLNITAKLSRLFHVQNFAYKLCKWIVPISTYKDMVSPESYLNAISPEKRNSCVCESQICANPAYDLQIVVPVYNVEKYLKECVESIIHQKTHYTYHVIFVNDGSSDNSRAILEEYSSNPMISIIDTPNQGVSAARNAALKNIDARYVMFVDSDDNLPEHAIEDLISKADTYSADILEGGHRYFKDSKTLQTRQYPEELTSSVRFTSFAWGKIYRASIWQNVCFPIEYWFEDMMVLLVLSPMTTKRGKIHEIVYNYRDTPTGYTRAYNQDKRRVESYWVTKQLLADAKTLGIEPTVYFYERFLQCCTMSTRRVAILGDRKADYALFEAQRQLRDIYFKDFRAQGEKEKRIESALLNDDFKEYLLYCLFLH